MCIIKQVMLFKEPNNFEVNYQNARISSRVTGSICIFVRCKVFLRQSIKILSLQLTCTGRQHLFQKHFYEGNPRQFATSWENLYFDQRQKISQQSLKSDILWRFCSLQMPVPQERILSGPIDGPVADEASPKNKMAEITEKC